MQQSVRPRLKKSTKKVRSPESPRADSTLVRLFHKMAAEVPAYKKFLKNAGTRAADIKTDHDLLRIPLTSKDNYLRPAKYADLFWGGSLATPHVLTSTSGSTGEPFFFGRSPTIDEQSALIHERFFLQTSLSKTESTLVIICFGMGIWIGGLLTYQAFELMSKRGHPISIITPGINRTEILKILRKLAPSYKQIILTGYPPFIKDVLDGAAEAGISLKNHKVAILFAAEAFTEQFRDYVVKKANIKNPLTDTMNVYGSADVGTMAFETPLSIRVRQIAIQKPEIFKTLFGDISKTPTLAQNIPAYTAFEQHEGQLLLSADSAMPLMRYAIGDNGGVYTFAEIERIMADHGVDLLKEMKAAKIPDDLRLLPFVYVYERSDLSATLYGLQVYPETVKEVLLGESFAPFLSGRLTLATRFDDSHDQYLEINVELRQGREASPEFSALLLAEIIKNLKEKNSEFRELCNFLGARSVPKIVYWPYEDPAYFRRDIKQRWVLKQN